MDKFWGQNGIHPWDLGVREMIHLKGKNGHEDYKNGGSDTQENVMSYPTKKKLDQSNSPRNEWTACVNNLMMGTIQ